jgi:simple sugar transport system permease protein
MLRPGEHDLAHAVGIPLAAAFLALVIGGVLIIVDGNNPLAVYAEVFRGVFVERNGLRETAVAATPLIFMGVGLSLAYRARAFTIGAEGQYLMGATVAVAWVTAGGVRDLPGPVLIVTGLVLAAVAGALWSALCGWLNARFGTNLVISSLLLNYVAVAFLLWMVRKGIRDPRGFVPQSRVMGQATLPHLAWPGTHLGFVLALVVVPVAAVLLARSRFGFRIDVLGHNPQALGANETSARRMLIAVLAVSGALAGLAGFVQVTGVNGRLNSATGSGFGFTAIVVALLGRLHPVGALAAALGLSGLTIGFETAERSYKLPSSVVGVVQALVVLLVVAGDALAARRRRAR